MTQIEAKRPGTFLLHFQRQFCGLGYYILRVSTGDTILALSLFRIFGFALLINLSGHT